MVSCEKYDNRPNIPMQADFIVEFTSEINDLPDLENPNRIGKLMGISSVPFGSSALCLEDGQLYYIRSDNTWKPL